MNSKGISHTVELVGVLAISLVIAMVILLGFSKDGDMMKAPKKHITTYKSIDSKFIK
ncbi:MULTISPECIES: hypothetical protein [Clostridium]|uniref:Uncharacterized protein n=3 Tax=Clostridium TaxID=1485 RepID=A0A3F2ZVD1_CLOB6|nr:MULTISPECIES: hypothetical protein [Clostridium]ACQ51200.1 hypothetical protein CLJ_0226 [Clostridium botulinum Ba4 str. 657]APH15245.1 hypothetical protein NPD5_3979 [Clostridium sporogenes]MDS1006506.1 hypothetical protein [Clostridium sporogenes]BAO05053.1 uncharacterized protein CBO05P2_028 [Clostridium botulinum B str. Osaka05]BDB03540.1 hypothetical protein CBOS2020_36140 [Clostridium botulinum]